MNARLKSRGLLLFIFLLTFLPFLLAFWLARHPSNLGAPTAHGHLITPAQPINRDLIQGIDAFARENLTELSGRWVLLHIVRGSDCDSACMESLHKSKQLRLMMNKDLTRIRRAALVLGRDSTPSNWPDDQRLLKLKANPTLVRLLTGLPIPQQQNSLVILDPLANLMMWYEQDFDPYQVRDDLKKLLSVSQIG